MERVSIADCKSTEAVDGVDIALLAGGEETNVQQFGAAPGAAQTALVSP